MTCKTKIFIFFILLCPPLWAQDNNHITLTDITHHVSSEGSRLYRIHAEKGYLKNMSSNRFSLEDIKLDWFEESKIKFTLSASRGFFDKSSGYVHLQDNVKGSGFGYDFQCRLVEYDNKKKIIYLKEDIKIRYANALVFANNGEYDVITKNLILKDKVRTYIYE